MGDDLRAQHRCASRILTRLPVIIAFVGLIAVRLLPSLAPSPFVAFVWVPNRHETHQKQWFYPFPAGLRLALAWFCWRYMEQFLLPSSLPGWFITGCIRRALSYYLHHFGWCKGGLLWHLTISSSGFILMPDMAINHPDNYNIEIMVVQILHYRCKRRGNHVIRICSLKSRPLKVQVLLDWKNPYHKYAITAVSPNVGLLLSHDCHQKHSRLAHLVSQRTNTLITVSLSRGIKRDDWSHRPKRLEHTKPPETNRIEK